MEHGKVYWVPKDCFDEDPEWLYAVLITDGEYISNGRISNHFSGPYVHEDGTLSDKYWNGYDYGYEEANAKAEIKTSVLFQEKL